RFVAGGLLGAAPWLVGLARNGTGLVTQPTTASTYAERLHVVTGALLPRFLGARGPFGQGWLLFGAGALLWWVAVAALLALTVQIVRARGRHTLTPVVVVV